MLPRALLALLQDQSTTVHTSAIEVYQGLAYDLLSERAPLTVGTKGQGQRTGLGAAQVNGRVGASKAAVGGTHPAGCRCKGCLAQKAEEDERRRMRIALNKGGSDELFRAMSEKPGADPFKIKKQSAELEKEQSRNKAPAKGKDKTNDDFTTVGEKLWKIQSVLDVVQFARTVELSRTTVGHALNDRSSRCDIDHHNTPRHTTIHHNMSQYH
jgi:hypothetical protein